MKGILLIALGHRNYFEMAKNLAASIKVHEPNLPICIVTDGSPLPIDRQLFDEIEIADPSLFTTDGKTDYIKTKLWMYDLSPYKETLFLDVDQIMLEGRKLADIFEELKNVDLTFSNTGKAEVSIWADISEVQKLYGPGDFWNFHSEFVYFKKARDVRPFFQLAKKIYADRKIKSATPFAGGAMADELAFQAAAMKIGIYPHKENWTPNFWYRRDRARATQYPYQLKKDYYTYSIGGPTLAANVVANYNNLATFYSRKMGLQKAYQARDKRTFLPERNKI